MVLRQRRRNTDAGDNGTVKRLKEQVMARILLAEDEDTLRAMLMRAFGGDHAVTAARDGAEALDLIVAGKGEYDLLLTDIKMPLMDGIALSLSVARDYPNITILMMTGFADQRERAHGLDAIVHDVVSKPFSLAQIRGAVSDALQAKAAA
jgi:two-component system cell cycle response regulator CpdR